ncbi:MAG: ABC transporter substrate-binding protein [Lachnospiraceae bacterium]
MKAKISCIIGILLVLSLFAGCSGQTDTTTQSTETPSPQVQATETSTEAAQITEDRQGNAITLPETVERVMTAGPSNTEILIGLGYADNIIAADTYSENVEGLPADTPLFDMTAPDVEKILELKPDVILVTGMVQVAGDDPYKSFKDAGICVIYIPSSNSIASIEEDIAFVAAVMGDASKSDAVIAEMEQKIAEIKAVGDTIEDKKSVYFEIAAAPDMYSFGKGVFLNEMIEIIGAENILQDQDEWVAVADEEVLSSNPDVILTSVNYIENPTEEIAARPGWEAITAVKNQAVYSIDTDASNNPSQNIVKALEEMAKAVYPEYY